MPRHIHRYHNSKKEAGRRQGSFQGLFMSSFITLKLMLLVGTIFSLGLGGSIFIPQINVCGCIE